MRATVHNFGKTVFLTSARQRAMVTFQAPCYEGAGRVDRCNRKKRRGRSRAVWGQIRRRSTGESSSTMEVFVQQLINGLTLGSIYGLIAIGYTMVFGIIGMVNFAH